MAFIQRTGQTDILRSEKLPVIDIQIDPAFKYAGSTSFILYDICHVEQHHFVVSDQERRVLRQLWFQFEGYLENNNYTYDYSLDVLNLNGFTFLHNAYTINAEEVHEARPTSDYAHVIDYLQEKGYQLSGDMLAHRLFWLDETLRNELMIIYWEALDATGYRISDIAEGGPSASAWAGLSHAVEERSLASFKVL
jgi:hypothetical protein